jgi:hypothetical protein
MSGCSALVSGDFRFSSLEAIPNDFMSYCTSMVTHAASFSKVMSVGDNYLRGCTALTDPLMDSDSFSFMGDNFMRDCTHITNWYQGCEINVVADSIGKNFLKGCISLGDMSFNLSQYTGPILDGFLEGCTSLNGTITFSAETTTIGNNFLKDCTSFTGSLSGQNYEWLSKITSIGDHFLENTGITEFVMYFNNYPYINGSTNYVPTPQFTFGTHFLYNAKSLTFVMWDIDSYPTDAYSFGYDDYARQIDVLYLPSYDGGDTPAQGLVNALPSKWDNVPYRFLNLWTPPDFPGYY